jgi:hypothetical protein
VREHGLHDRLAAVSRPGGVGADVQAGAPIRQAEAAQTQVLLQFEQMLSVGSARNSGRGTVVSYSVRTTLKSNERDDEIRTVLTDDARRCRCGRGQG